MKRSRTSHKWLQEHFSDEYVKRAKQQGVASRAYYKLEEIQQKYQLIKAGDIVIDLGAAPGGFSELVAKIVGERGHVFALDKLVMAPLANVTLLQGDFTEQAVLDALLAKLDGKKADVILSDMAPSMSGIKMADQAQVMHFAELALDLASQVLKPQGDLLIKVFHGEGFDDLLQSMRQQFTKVIICKPKASRARSSEAYLLARGYNGRAPDEGM